ncbi:MAG: Ldh family oxidoreductase [Hyphomicrobiaceae bacterium]|nr:Ldh family oxidoreductase [Hyphomicrobiaceae bacterium]
MTKTVQAEVVRSQIERILTAWGMPSDMVATTADVMVETDLWGVDSHGISMIMMYEDMLREGRLKVSERPRVERETAVTALIDGNAGLGHPVSVMGMKLAVEKAKAGGIGLVTVRNSHHFGAAGYYSKIAADQGCVGFVTSTARGVTVVPTGGTNPVLGTNPISIAAPAKRNRPFLLDMATSTVAVGKVKVYSFYERPLPEGWVMDGEGKPMRDAAAAFALLQGSPAGGLTPIGGTRDLGSHKGYGLGVVAQILAGALTGASFSPLRNKDQGAGVPYNIGHFFLAIDPLIFRAEGEFEDDLDEVIDFLHAQPAADAAKPVLVAGDPEAATRDKRLVEGIPIPPALWDKVKDVAERAGVPFLFGL